MNIKNILQCVLNTVLPATAPIESNLVVKPPLFNKLLALMSPILHKKQKIEKYICVLAVLVLTLTKVHAQSQTPALSNPIPPSPEALSLFKFSTLPVSKFTGIPDISIPLYDIKGKRIGVHIGLNYHSGGIRVTEAASSVGMGWALNCGGVITQTIRGIDDYNGLFGRFLKPTNMRNPSICDAKAAVEQQQDNEPDMFSYSFNGNSGSFILDTLGHPMQIEEKKMKIENFYGSGGDFPLGGGMGWKITDIQGIQYIFESFEAAVSRSQQLINGNTIGTLSHGVEGSKTWYLNKIIDMPGDTISFKYNSINTTDYVYTSDTQVQGSANPLILLGASCNVPNYISHSHQDMFELRQNYLLQINGRMRLNTVTFPGGYVQFIPGGNRCDLYGDTYLGKVLIYNTNNAKIKEYDLNYNYMVGNQFVSTSSIDCSSESVPSISQTGSQQNNFVKRRLFLMAIDEIDGNNNKIDSYGMQYQVSLGLPSRFSAQQDMWGYYNGNGYTSLLQNMVPNGGYIGPFQTFNVLGNGPNFTYAQQGILTKITYPTGGYSAFDYELNSNAVTTPDSVKHSISTFSIPAGTSGSQTLSNFSVETGANIPFELDICTYGASGTGGGFSIINTQNNAVVVSEATVLAQLANGKVMSFTFTPGNYAIISSAYTKPCTYQVSMLPWREVQSPYHTNTVNKDYGGLRIKDIMTFDPVTQSLLEKQYQYVLPNGLSSMVMFNSPVNTGNQLVKLADFDCTGGDCPNCGPPPFTIGAYDYLEVSSGTCYPLATAQNGLFGYSYVTEKDINSNSGIDDGYTVSQSDVSASDQFFSGEFSFTGSMVPFNIGNYPDYFPVAPSADLSWLRGKPTSEEHYKRNTDGTYSCIERKKYYYSRKSTGIAYGYSAAYRMQIGAPFTPTPSTCPNFTGTGIDAFDIIGYTPYQILAGYQTLDSASTEKFDNLLHGVKTVNYYTYGANNLLPNLIKAVNSKNEVVTTNLTYPLDYPISGTPTDVIAKGIQNLQNQYVIGQAIENYTQKSNIDGSNLRTISAVLTTYKPTVILPDTIYKWEPMPLAGATFSPLSISSSAVNKDINYQPQISFDAFDPLGNILKQHKINGAYEAYQWGYNGEYPVAQVVNAGNNDIFYEGFEEGNGNSTLNDAKTGHYSHTNTYSKALSGLDPGNYILTYWQKSGSAWSLVSIPVAVSGSTYTIGASPAINAQIDDVRFYPAAAQMITYTYDPLVGMTSSTDAKGMVTYYEYDGFQRLINIKDKDGNIVKHIDYHYQQ